MRNKRIKIIIGIVVSIIIVVLVILNAFKSDNKKNEDKKVENNFTPGDEEVWDTNVKWDNLDNAKIVDNQKIGTSSKLDEEHEIYYWLTGKKSKLTSKNVKVYSDKEVDLIDAEIPITNNGNTTFEEGRVTIDFYRKNKTQIHSGSYAVLSIAPGETYVVKIQVDNDITNAYDFDVHIE